MKKGKFGVCLWFYAVLAFILAFLGQTLLCGLLMGFVIAAEKDEWLSRQVIQAFLLALFGEIVDTTLNMTLGIFYSIPFVGNVFNSISSIISSIVSVAILVFVIIAIVKTLKGNDAGVPGFSKLAGKAFGYVTQKFYAQPQQPQQPYYQPTQQPQYQQPIHPQQNANMNVRPPVSQPTHPQQNANMNVQPPVSQPAPQPHNNDANSQQ